MYSLALESSFLRPIIAGSQLLKDKAVILIEQLKLLLSASMYIKLTVHCITNRKTLVLIIVVSGHNYLGERGSPYGYNNIYAKRNWIRVSDLFIAFTKYVVKFFSGYDEQRKTI